MLRKNVPHLIEKRTKNLVEARKGENRYIVVDEYTTKDDVVNAFRLIASAQTMRPKEGRKRRNQLVAVQYAILRDEFGWTYKQIAQKYERLTDETFLRRVKEYADLGREILKSS